MTSPVILGEVLSIDYQDLCNGKDLSIEIGNAFGSDGLGLLTIFNIPNYVEFRKRLLPLAYKFAMLPEDIKSKYVHEESKYSFGWSHGKEKLQGKPDVDKGSYYNNPQYDRPVDDEHLISKYPAFIHPNIWPDELPELTQAFKELGSLIVAVGKLIAIQADIYVKSKCPEYDDNKLFSIIDSSKCCKGRLLHYFSKDSNDKFLDNATDISTFSSWCGWHNDHGSLTGLTSAMFLDEQGAEVICNDVSSGLYILNRKSNLIKIRIPEDHLAFQIGETAQIHSGGILQATPHAVKGSSIRGISRETFAVFMEPMWDEPMVFPSNVDIENVQSQSSSENLPCTVPSIRSRWSPSQNFGEFTSATLSAYY